VPPVAPVSPVQPVAPEVVINPAVNPVYQPTNNGVKATDPIMMPEPAPAPDPIEEELKAPMKAAAPVPGSIGSAVSGTPNVAFNDPATMPDVNPMTQQMGVPAKAKSSKTTLIVLIIVALLIVVALGVVLFLQLNPGNGSSSGDGGSGSTPTPTPVPEETKEVLSCSRSMTADEIAVITNAVSGTVKVETEYDDDDELETVSMVKYVVYSSDDGTTNEPVEFESRKAKVKDLKQTTALMYDLPVTEEGELKLSLEDIQTNYESLDYTCETL
jgi:flagellar basal body-associated protein FliL